MNKKLLFLPLLLIVVTMSGEPVVRVVRADGSGKAFATDNVRKLVLTSASVDVVNNEGSVLLRVPKEDIVRVEFTDGMPDTEAVCATIIQDDNIVKILENGKVYILRDGKKFTIMGIEVEQK